MTRERRADEEVEGVLRIDRNPGDRATLRRGEATGDQDPEVAAIEGLEEAHARLGVTGAIWLPGADKDVLAVFWINPERADRIGKEAERDRLPGGRVGQRVVGAPDTATSSAEVEPAVAWMADRADSQRSDASRGNRRIAGVGPKL